MAGARVEFTVEPFEAGAPGDHVHAADWSNAGDDGAATIAASQADTNAQGGKPKTRDALSNYSFLDGHAETLRFKAVYAGEQTNRFFPPAAH